MWWLLKIWINFCFKLLALQESSSFTAVKNPLTQVLQSCKELETFFIVQSWLCHSVIYKLANNYVRKIIHYECNTSMSHFCILLTVAIGQFFLNTIQSFVSMSCFMKHFKGSLSIWKPQLYKLLIMIILSHLKLAGQTFLAYYFEYSSSLSIQFFCQSLFSQTTYFSMLFLVPYWCSHRRGL